MLARILAFPIPLSLSNLLNYEHGPLWYPGLFTGQLALPVLRL